MMRTNIVLDEKLVKAALKITKLKTKKDLIDFALRELLRHEKQKDLLSPTNTIVMTARFFSWHPENRVINPKTFDLRNPRH